MEGVITAIVVTTLALLSVSLVVNQLLRLKKWLNAAPKTEPPKLQPPKSDPPDQP